MPTRWANASVSAGATGAPVEIVGVAQTIKYKDTIDKPIDFVYLPLTQHPIARMVLLVRSTGDPLQLVEPVKDVVRTLDPNMPLLETRTYEDLYRYGNGGWSERGGGAGWHPGREWASCWPSPACTGWWRTT